MAIYAGQYGPESIEYTDGGHAIGVPVKVLNLDGTEATLYRDSDKTGTDANPVYTDDYGNLTFWATAGRYVISVEGMELEVVVQNDPREPGSAIPDSRYLQYEHRQTAQEREWTITHTLPFQPAGVKVRYDQDPPDVTRLVPFSYIGSDVVVVHNSAPARGTAILS